jgi:phage terminase large subunit-like protein
MADLRTYACRASLAVFMREFWHVVEPGRKLIWNWHLDAICDHLEAVSDGRIKDMAITIPPGTTKSRANAVFWPAWVWIKQPGLRWLFVSNSEDTSSETSMACRRLIESPEYRGAFNIKWKLRIDQDTKSWFENTMGGHRISLGIGSNVTGKKGDIVVVDDANDAQKVESLAERKRVNSKYDNAIWDRVIDFANGAHVTIGQRTHEDDLIGHTLRTRGWFELRIPEEFRKDRRFTSPIGWTDPRKHNGELLRPVQFPLRIVKAMRMGNLLLYQAKHLQEPRSKDGIRFKAAWLQKRWRWDADRTHIILTDERGDYRFHAWNDIKARYGTADGAASAKTSADFTAICAWLLTHRGDLLWIGARRVQAEIPEQPAILAEEYNRHRMQWASVEGVMSNVAFAQLASRTNMVIKTVSPLSRDKLSRATPAIILTESGKLWLPEDQEAARTGFPLAEAIDELISFTGDEKLDKHDDLVDNLSYATDERSLLVETGSGAGVGVSPGPTPGGQLLQGTIHSLVEQYLTPTSQMPPGYMPWHGRR